MISTWANTWNLHLNPNKSEHLSFSRSKTTHDATSNTLFLSSVPIPQTDSVRDLGVTLSNNFKWPRHITNITSKARNVSYTVLKAFTSNDKSIFINLYKTFIRPLLEYNTPIWTPHLTTDIKNVEQVQRYFTRRLCQKLNLKFTSYSDRLNELKLDSLETRRTKFDLILLYKIFNGLIDINFKDFFSQTSSITTYNLRGHNLRLHAPKFSRSSARENFFSGRILHIWNKLPEHLVNAPSLVNFKALLDKFSLNTICTTNF